jgi:4-hydroxybenzoate polyprenyltransferase
LFMLFAGVLFAGGAAVQSGTPRPAWVAAVLAAMVLAYDRVLKRTPVGPLAMGACRLLNVLFGASVTEVPWGELLYVAAGGVGLYIVGVTWFARTEAVLSNRGQLSAATAVMLAGLGLLASLPLRNAARFAVEPWWWAAAWGLLALSIGWRCVWAVIAPEPMHVQRAVKQCLTSLIVLDAVVALPFAGPAGAVAILALLFPMVNLGRWIYST